MATYGGQFTLTEIQGASLAIAALHYRGDWNCARLWREDRDAANWLKSFRVKISLDTSVSADELRRIIDRLTEQG